MNDDAIAYYSKLVDELGEGIEKGFFSKDYIPEKYKWKHLMALFYLSDILDGGKEMFSTIYSLIIKSSEKRIRKKARNGEKIKVSFQSYSAAQWPAESIYRTFEKDERFEVGVIVSPLCERDEISRKDAYSQCTSYFRENNYRVYEGMKENGTYPGFDELGGIPDILFLTSSWFSALPQSQWFIELPLNTLTGYIPYGLYMMDNADGSYASNIVYNKEMINLMWRVYCDCSLNLDGYRKHQLLEGKNVRLSGYCKMDYFYEDRKWSDEDVAKIWKIPEGKNPKSVKKVIIAPHYSVCDKGPVLLSTFQKNLWFFLYLAEKYRDEVSFVLKPHPNLRLKAVNVGLFKSYEEYDEYIKRWENLPNAKVIQDAGYLELFDTSDAMIMDSGSFLGEYLYTGKPLLYLTRPEQAFLPTGKKVVETYYKTPGENYFEIEKFLDDVVIKGNDYMKEDRSAVFKEEYDYKSINGTLASEYICNDVYELMNA